MSSLIQASSFLAERAGKKTDITFIKGMKDLVVLKRARFMANSLSKSNAIERFYLQFIDAPLKEVDRTNECNTEDISDCDKVLRTIDKIPRPIRYGVHPYPYVGAPGGAKGYTWTTFGQVDAMKRGRKITGKWEKWTYINDYIYIFNKDIDSIRIEGVFADPRQLAKFKCIDENGDSKVCFSEEQDFPVDDEMMELIIRDILITELRIILAPSEKIQIKEDKNV